MLERRQLKQMIPLVAGESPARAAAGAAEMPRRAPPAPKVTPRAELSDRKGFAANFIPGFRVPLPKPSAKWKDDLHRIGRYGELAYQNFSVVMSKSRRLALFVAVNINGVENVKIKRERDAWFLDGRIAEKWQTGQSIYDGNDLDRGHLVRRQDPVWGESADQANDDTFHFTNCAPQHAQMNRKTWLSLEDYILKNAVADGMLINVYTGPVLSEYDRLYRDVKIPSRYWKVITFISDDGRKSATGYMLTQADLIKNLEFTFGPYKTYQVPLTTIERATGLSFGALTKLDGFSTQEAVTGRPQAREINGAGDILV